MFPVITRIEFVYTYSSLFPFYVSLFVCLYLFIYCGAVMLVVPVICATMAVE
jgi:hypothetical protein